MKRVESVLVFLLVILGTHPWGFAQKDDEKAPVFLGSDGWSADSFLFIPKNFRNQYPFADRGIAEGSSRFEHGIRLETIQFETQTLVQRRNNTRLFLSPDVTSFPPHLILDEKLAFQRVEEFYIVQTSGIQTVESLRKVLLERGKTIYGYFPDDAYLTKLNPADVRDLTAVDQVAWLGLFQPAWRIAPRLDYVIQTEPDRFLGLTAIFEKTAFSGIDDIIRTMSFRNLQVVDVAERARGWKVLLEGSAISAQDLVLMDGCIWVERNVEHFLHGNVARSSANITTGRNGVAGPIMDVEDVWNRGIRGEGQVAAGSDTGLSTGNLATLHHDYGQQGSATNPMRVIAGYALGRATWDDNQTTGGGHGTHTSGSIVGNGVRSGATPNTNTFPATSFTGTAPKANFVFQSIMDSGGNLGGIPADLNNLFQTPYNDGARVHSNSWGAPIDGQYNANSQDVDEFTWNNQDMVVTFSAGNSGRDGQQSSGACNNQPQPLDGVIDNDSIGAPGTAKNSFTVGASENYRPDFVYEFPQNDCTSNDNVEQKVWGWFNGCNFSANPINGDFMADNASGMGAFSSRGPTDDGRFKPDIVAPGIAIISTRTDLNQAYEQWGICQVPVALRPFYLTQGGTSMSNPLTAGAATLVRQYYFDGWHPNNSLVTHAAPNPADGFNPSAALVKATLVNGAFDMSPGQYGGGATQEIPPNWDTGNDLPNNAEGFGRVDVEAALFQGSGFGQDPGRQMEVHDVSAGLQTGQFTDYNFAVGSNAGPLIITLVWTDPFASLAAATKLVNNLNVTATVPGGGTIYLPNGINKTSGVDNLNNIEQIKVTNPPVGNWTIRVTGASVPGNGQAGTNTQPYALVMSAVMQTCTNPATPTGLNANASAANQIDLNWNAVTADGYNVYRSTTMGGPYTQVANNVATNSFSDTTVLGGFTYYYIVRALNLPNCESGASNEATALAFGECGVAPTFGGLTSLVALPNNICGFRLEWNDATANCGSGVVVYNVYRSTTPGFTPGPANLQQACITNTFFEDTQVAVGTTYYYVVRAEDDTIGHGGSCQDGNEDTNTTELSGTASPGGSGILYSSDFESGSGLDGWTTGTFGAGDSTNWRGIQTCTARSGSNIFRFGAVGCTANYASNHFQFAVPDGATGIAVPAGATNVTLDFWHRYQFENNFDGGLLTLSLDGSNFSLITAADISGHTYNGTAGTFCATGGSGNAPIFTNNQSSFVNTVADLDSVCDTITGGSGGCAGQTIYIGFTGITDCSVTQDGWFLDDVMVTADVGAACTTAPNRPAFLTATATSGQAELEWLNPSSGGYAATIVTMRTDRFPENPADGTQITNQNDGLGNKGSFTHTSLTNNTTYYYTAYVDNGSGEFSAGTSVTARPFNTAGSPIPWAYSTGASSMAPPGIGSVYGVSNDRVFHSMETGMTGGTWPTSWTPLAMNGPAQARPSIAPISLGGASKVAFLGSQDGNVYAIDADTGNQIWVSASPLGTMVQGGATGMFTTFGGSFDLIFAGTRDAGTDNRIVGLNLANGTQAWAFNNGGGANGIGIIAGTPTVDYATNRLYFCSRERTGGSNNTVWCISFNGSSASLEWARNLGDIDGSPIAHGGVVYVGTNQGEVHALNATTGANMWAAPFVTNDGPIKGYIFPKFGTTDLFFSTTTQTWSIRDNGASTSLNWSTSNVPNPSIPLVSFSDPYVWVGGSDGRLYQLDVANGMVDTSIILGDGTAAVGSPALDVINSTAYVGTTGGHLYPVMLPLP